MDALDQLCPLPEKKPGRFRKITLAPNFHPPPVTPPPLAWTPYLEFARYLYLKGKLSEW